MASSKFALIDVQNDDQEIDLQFKDFGDASTSQQKKHMDEQTIYFSEFPDSAIDDSEKKLLDEDSIKKPSYSFWSFEYYQQYFNVESRQVGDRILWSAFPKPGINYLQTCIRPNPDLYGPFWVCITLVLTTAISGNIAVYLQTPFSYHWKYDFHKVTLAASLICSYAWLVPIIIWGLLLWRGSKANLTLLELICIYGYSLSVFVPVSILWTIPLVWLQWCLGIVATVLSGSVLIRTILPSVSHEAKKIAILTAFVILILHAALALGFMLYFFYTPPVKGSNTSDISQLSPNQSQPIENKNNNSQINPKDLEVSKSERSSGINLLDKNLDLMPHSKINMETQHGPKDLVNKNNFVKSFSPNENTSNNSKQTKLESLSSSSNRFKVQLDSIVVNSTE